ncbi:uncharacterized protein LOC126765690 [Bactrocera neohumeralis]|uniref:uncharacterized protein LOC126765690 n=1 Tax=Bactrocera neohumeralis TaxID=98809 RepID=UPI0021655126|nr:uncharacterized protein LOC126765690 [Bactrocera neohumeralis]
MISSSRKKKIVAIMCICVHLINKKKQIKEKPKLKKRSVWVLDWLQRRNTDGAYAKTLREFREVNNQKYLFKNYLRMNEATFNYILELVSPNIKKSDTNMRKAIPANERLAVTLRFLASGDSFKSLSVDFRIAPNTISIFVPEVCDAIYKALKNEYLQVPNNEQMWIDIAQKFSDKWNFPHCIGAVDGKHIVMKAPPRSGSTFYNYKGTNSIVLMAIADADYRFIYIDVGCNGRVSDGGVFGKSTFQKALDNNTLRLPLPQPLLNRDRDCPYLLVADDAFRMQKHILKPYPGKNLTAGQRIFNYRLSRARRVVENAFGIMAKRFQILYRPIQLNEHKTTQITLACCALHNFLIKKNASYLEGLTTDRNDQQDNSVHEQQGAEERPTTYITNEAKEIREEFEQYFMTAAGEIPFQYA